MDEDSYSRVLKMRLFFFTTPNGNCLSTNSVISLQKQITSQHFLKYQAEIFFNLSQC